MRHAIALVLLMSSASVLRAQSTNASLAGRVTDPSKALIVDATVAAISADTNIRYETTHERLGRIPPRESSSPASIASRSKRPGFKKLIKPDVSFTFRTLSTSTSR